MPPMWNTFAHILRIPSGIRVGADEKTKKSKLMTGSDRIKIAAQRFDAVAVAVDDNGYLSLSAYL
jgi:hypothetical protein